MIDPRTGLDDGQGEGDPFSPASMMRAQIAQGATPVLPAFNGVNAALFPPGGGAPPAAPAPAPAPQPLIPELQQALATVPPPAATAPVAKTPGVPGGGGPPIGGMTPAEKKAQEALAGTEAAQVETAKKEGEAGKEKAAGQAEFEAAQAKRVDEFNQVWAQKSAAATQHLQQLEDERAKMKVKDLFEGRPGAAIAAALMEGLGAFAASMTGSPNFAMQVINKQVENYRQQQLDKVDQASKGVENAKWMVENARMEMNAQEAGMYKSIAQQRAANLAKFGKSDAEVAADKIVQAASKEAEQRQAQNATMLANRGEEQRQHAAQRALIGSEIGKNNAETAKLGAEAAAAGTKEESGRGFGVRVQKATLTEKGRQALEIHDRLQSEGVTLTDADRQKYQNNLAEVEKAKHMSLFEQEAGRKLGLLATDPYKGFSDKKRQLLQANELLTQVGAGVTNIGASEHEMEHGRQIFDLNSPGATPAMRDQVVNQVRGIVGGAAAAGGKVTESVARGAAAEQAAAPPTADVSAAKAWLASPAARADTAKAAAVAAKLRAMGAM